MSESKNSRVGAVVAVGALGLITALGFWWLRTPPPRTDVPKVEIVHDADAGLQQAAREARDRLPEFRERLQGAQPGEQFAIRGRFETSAGPEYLWLRAPIYTEGSYQATLDQQPIALEAKKGDQLTVAEDEVYDWIIRDADGQVTGAFTEQALGRDR